MDFKSLKEKIINFKDNTIDKMANSLAESNFVIRNKEELSDAIEKSKNTIFVDKKTRKRKTNIKHTIIIFTWKDSDFYKDFLLSFSVMATKAWTQWITLKLSDMDKEDLQEYDIKEFPSLVLFTNRKLKKVIVWEENIKKIVKSLNFNIIEKINNF